MSNEEFQAHMLGELRNLSSRISTLETRTIGLVTLGPKDPTALELGSEARRVEKIVTAALRKFDEEGLKDKGPVDRSCRVLASGDAVPEDSSHAELKENGQQKDYVVLCDNERARGFVRRYRDAYRHIKCGKITTMARKIAETYARDPHFYTGTFCTTCLGHFPIGEDGEFVWYEMDGATGPKVGT